MGADNDICLQFNFNILPVHKLHAWPLLILILKVANCRMQKQTRHYI